MPADEKNSIRIQDSRIPDARIIEPLRNLRPIMFKVIDVRNFSTGSLASIWSGLRGARVVPERKRREKRKRKRTLIYQNCLFSQERKQYRLAYCCNDCCPKVQDRVESKCSFYQSLLYGWKDESEQRAHIYNCTELRQRISCFAYTHKQSL